MQPVSKLEAWINLHDCGVTPTAIRMDDGSIGVRVLCVNTETGAEHIEITKVRNYQEARDALGY